MSRVNIGLVGVGTIGSGVVKILAKQKDFFFKKLGLPATLVAVADKNTDVFKTLPLGGVKCYDSADDILNDETIDIVIELVGGTTFAKSLVLKAIDSGKHVVTANKALLAEYGPEIFEAASQKNVSVYFEAAVGGGMPSIKTIRESMVGNEVLSVKTIINGTCNYILTKMSEEGLAFDDVLKQAQENGFAEADPTLDIEGGDTGHKVAIMASLLYGGYVPYEKLNIEGITKITSEDILYADQLGYKIKLLGVIKKSENESVVDARVHPAMIKKNDILASVSNEFNAVLLSGDAVGDILLYGKGAGEMPTASAVISDVIDIARNIVSGSVEGIKMDYYAYGMELPLKPSDEIENRFYLRFSVVDRPNVLAQIANILGGHGISIASVIQKESEEESFVPVVILTHTAKESSLSDAIKTIEEKDFVKEKTQIIRIES